MIKIEVIFCQELLMIVYTETAMVLKCPYYGFLRIAFHAVCNTDFGTSWY